MAVCFHNGHNQPQRARAVKQCNRQAAAGYWPVGKWHFRGYLKGKIIAVVAQPLE